MMRARIHPINVAQYIARVLTALGIVTGCGRAPVITPAPVPIESAASHATIRTAESRIRSALARSDTALLAAMLDAQVTFAYPRRTSRGRDQVADALAGVRLGSGEYRTLVTFDEPAPCDRGVTLSGIYAISQRQASGTVGVEHGGFAIRVVTADTSWRVVEIVFDRSGNVARQALTSSCRELRVVRVEASRFRVAVLPLAVAGWSVNQVLESELSTHGWTRAAAAGPTTDVSGKSHTRSDGAAPIVATVSVRLVRALDVELTTGLRSRSGALTTYNPARSSLLTQRYDARPINLALTAHWRLLRVGAGPAMVFSRWREGYEHVMIDATTDPPSYRNDFPASVDSTWTRRSIGAALNVTSVLPLSRHVFATTTAATLIGSRAGLPGVPTHEHWVANLDARYVAVGFGFAW